MPKDAASVRPVWPGMCVPSLGSSGIHKGHCDVPYTGGGRQAFVVVGEAARMQEGPAFTRSLNGAVVAEEPASTTLQSQHNTHYHLTPKGPRGGFACFSQISSLIFRVCLTDLTG